MKRKILLTIYIFIICGTLESKIYIDIEAPQQKKLNIAIAEPIPMDATSTDTKFISTYLATIRRNIELSGFFEQIDPRAFLEENTQSTIEREKINFKSWSIIGAEALLKTGFWATGDKYRVIVRLYDTVNAETLLAKTYECDHESIRQLANKISNEIIKAFTGKEGFYGSKIAFVSNQTGKKELYIMDTDGTNIQRITNHRTAIVSPSWSPDGTKLLFTSYLARNPDVYIYDFTQGKMSPLSRREGLNIGGSFSPDGKYLALTLSYEGNPEIYLMELDTKKPKRLTNYWGIDVSPTFSPHGDKIAFVSDRSGSPQIYVMDTDGKNVKRITYEGKYNASPQWSPDGRKIAFSGMINDNNFKIFIVNPDGTELLQLTNGEGSDENPSWSPDSRYIIFSSTRDGNGELYITNITGTYLYRLTNTPYNESHPAWSPVLDFKLSKR